MAGVRSEVVTLVLCELVFPFGVEGFVYGVGLQASLRQWVVGSGVFLEVGVGKVALLAS